MIYCKQNSPLFTLPVYSSDGSSAKKFFDDVSIEIKSSIQRIEEYAKYMKDESSEVIKNNTKPFIDSNKTIMEMGTLIKNEILKTIDIVNSIKMWIQLNIPKIGGKGEQNVFVQKSLVAEFDNTGDMCSNLLDTIMQYFTLRGDIVRKIIKYPKIEDFKLSLQEMDENRIIQLKLQVLDLRNVFTTLLDIMNKNIAIIIPKKKKSDTSTVWCQFFSLIF